MGMSPSCHCICPGEGSIGSSGSGGGTPIPTNNDCTFRCISSITAQRYSVAWSPVAECAGDWANAEYAGPFICDWDFQTGAPLFQCQWRSTSPELCPLYVVDKTSAGCATTNRVTITLGSGGFSVFIDFYGVEEAAACTAGAPPVNAYARLKYTHTSVPTLPLNCLATWTLDNMSVFVGLSTVNRIGPYGITYKTAGSNAFPASVTLTPSP